MKILRIWGVVLAAFIGFSVGTNFRPLSRGVMPILAVMIACAVLHSIWYRRRRLGRPGR